MLAMMPMNFLKKRKKERKGEFCDVYCQYNKRKSAKRENKLENNDREGMDALLESFEVLVWVFAVSKATQTHSHKINT